VTPADPGSASQDNPTPWDNPIRWDNPSRQVDTTRQENTGQLAKDAVRLLTAAGQTVAIAESLTGGLVAAALTSVPGASVVVRGGVIAYATELKTALLDVPSDLLARYGAVHPGVAAAMAIGVRQRLGATAGGPHDGGSRARSG
jgi:nicotinamide mononucleotide (NMN) deamidase PncC